MDGNIFLRGSIKQICSFILYNNDNPNAGNSTYGERLKKGRNQIHKRLEQIYSDRDELENALADLNEALTVYEDVFMEIGVKSGARIMFQLLQDDCTEIF